MDDKQALSSPKTRRILGRVLGIGIICAAIIAVILALLQWELEPQTDDATVRADFVGIAPQVNGHIVELYVQDNQLVHEGDLLFVIDPRPYEVALERARASLALTRKEVDGLKNAYEAAAVGVSLAEAQLSASAAEVKRREMDPVAADAEISRLKAQFQHAADHLRRLEPLLPQQFVTADRVDEARTQRATAQAALNEAQARKRAADAALLSTRAQHEAAQAALLQARSEKLRAEDSIGQIDGVNARVAAAEAAVHAAELDLNYCRVYAPFTGLVVNKNISNGAFARTGQEVFTLVDTRTWYVVANFRETQLRHVHAGTPVRLYLQSRPGKYFQGTVVGLGWAVLPENGTSVNGLPRVERALDWIRLAARFPVRIKVENPDDSFRLGASAVATIRGTFHEAGR
jgi:multidrug efflux system membrane fusion protein